MKTALQQLNFHLLYAFYEQLYVQYCKLIKFALLQIHKRVKTVIALHQGDCD